MRECCQITQNLDTGSANRNNDINKYLLNRQLNISYLSEITPNEIEDTLIKLKDHFCDLYNFSTYLFFMFSY